MNDPLTTTVVVVLGVFGIALVLWGIPYLERRRALRDCARWLKRSSGSRRRRSAR